MGRTVDAQSGQELRRFRVSHPNGPPERQIECISYYRVKGQYEKWHTFLLSNGMKLGYASDFKVEEIKDVGRMGLGGCDPIPSDSRTDLDIEGTVCTT